MSELTFIKTVEGYVNLHYIVSIEGHSNKELYILRTVDNGSHIVESKRIDNLFIDVNAGGYHESKNTAN